VAADSEGKSTYLYVRGAPVLSMAEFEDYVYALPEEAVPPATLTRWAFGEPVEPRELLTCLQDEASFAAGESDEALEIIRLAAERLKRAFPYEARATSGR
jgi:hypothetical protein